jgi:hypothetical protein
MTNKIMALAYDYAASCERRELTGRVFARAALDKEVKAEQDYTRAVISERDALRNDHEAIVEAYEIEIEKLRKELAELREAEPKPLPGSDWTITMRRMMECGCSKRECTCKPENAPNCIWWDEPGDRPQPKAEPVQEPVAWANSYGLVSIASGGGYDVPLYAAPQGLRKAAQQALEALDAVAGKGKLCDAAILALRKELGQ